MRVGRQNVESEISRVYTVIQLKPGEETSRIGLIGESKKEVE